MITIDHTFHRTLLRADAALPAATFAGRQRDIRQQRRQGAARISEYSLRKATYGKAGDGSRTSSTAWGGRSPRAGRPQTACSPIWPRHCLSWPRRRRGPVRFPPHSRHEGRREASRYSGRTAIDADRAIHEPKPPSDSDTPFTFSMEGYQGAPPPPSFRASARRAGTLPRQSTNSSRRSTAPYAEATLGVRLFDASGPGRQHTYFHTDVPEPFVPRDGLFLVVPFYHVFGSDEMSVMTPEVRRLAAALCSPLRERHGASARIDNDAAVAHSRAVLLQARSENAPGAPPGVAAVPMACRTPR